MALSDSEGVGYGDRVPRPRSRIANGSPVRRHSTLKKRRTEPSSTVAEPRPRKSSFSPGRSDSIHIDYRRRRDMGLPAGVDPWMRPNGYRSNEKIEEIMRTGAPTLHGRGSSQRLTRRKSSKRRRTDHDREAEIKAMTSPSRTRSMAEARNFTRPTRTSSKRIKTGPPPGRSWEHPSSDVSLPAADSIRSGMSSDSEHGAFRLATLASLAPHPTLHYVVSPRWGSPPSQPPSRSGSQKRKLSERPPTRDDPSQSRKRIDDLANDFDASDIRELMERDKRRRERKKLRDQARAESRISRMAEERKAAQAKAAQEGSPPPPNLERGVVGRELTESGPDSTSAVVTSSRLRHTDADQSQLEGSSGGPVPEVGSQRRSREPLSEFHDPNHIPGGSITPQDGPEPPPVEPYTPPSPTSPILRKFSKSKKNASKSSFEPGQSKSTLSSPPARLEEVRTSQSESLRKVRMSISALFRWTSRRNRQSSGPSSFSNTSREEMQAAAQAQVAASTSFVPPMAASADSSASVVPTMKVSVGTPKRTRSRFREDLPEIPLSPPDSRRASLDATPPIPEHPDMQQAATKDGRPSTPTDRAGDEVMRQTPVSQHEDDNGPSPAPHSISLASIDSEGSWLSGRLTKRSPGSRKTLREQANSRAASTNGTEEELGITEDEYLSRLAPARLMRTMPSQRQTPMARDAIPSSDEDELMSEGEVKLGAVNARRQPGVVDASSRPRAVSRISCQGVVGSCEEEH